MDYSPAFAVWFKEVTAGETQSKTAEKLGISQAYVSRLRAGQVPGLEILERIAQTYERPLGEARAFSKGAEDAQPGGKTALLFRRTREFLIEHPVLIPFVTLSDIHPTLSPEDMARYYAEVIPELDGEIASGPVIQDGREVYRLKTIWNPVKYFYEQLAELLRRAHEADAGNPPALLAQLRHHFPSGLSEMSPEDVQAILDRLEEFVPMPRADAAREPTQAAGGMEPIAGLGPGGDCVGQRLIDDPGFQRQLEEFLYWKLSQAGAASRPAPDAAVEAASEALLNQLREFAVGAESARPLSPPPAPREQAAPAQPPQGNEEARTRKRPGAIGGATEQAARARPHDTGKGPAAAPPPPDREAVP